MQKSFRKCVETAVKKVFLKTKLINFTFLGSKFFTQIIEKFY